eukprot:10073606-Lingulodinium_polyedra.AAC.1
MVRAWRVVVGRDTVRRGAPQRGETTPPQQLCNSRRRGVRKTHNTGQRGEPWHGRRIMAKHNIDWHGAGTLQHRGPA